MSSESSEGNWKSEIRWEKGGQAGKNQYVDDGDLHVCPSADTKIRGQQTVTIDVDIRETYLLKDGTCVPDGKGRFMIDYKRGGPQDETYRYQGHGRVLDNGSALIYGTVTKTPEGGADDGGDTGTWEATRGGLGGHGGGGGEGPGHSGGEGPEAAASETTTSGGAH